jgi:L-histidine N-alpha-methyltransferase
VRNSLTVANRRLAANFEQRRFAFESHWDETQEWMEIGFIAIESHRVQVDELDIELAFAEGEKLRLEVSTKFRREGVEAELAAAGLATRAWWTDDAGDFALLLATR